MNCHVTHLRVLIGSESSRAIKSLIVNFESSQLMIKFKALILIKTSVIDYSSVYLEIQYNPRKLVEIR